MNVIKAGAVHTCTYNPYLWCYEVSIRYCHYPNIMIIRVLNLTHTLGARVQTGHLIRFKCCWQRINSWYNTRLNSKGYHMQFWLYNHQVYVYILDNCLSKYIKIYYYLLHCNETISVQEELLMEASMSVQLLKQANDDSVQLSELTSHPTCPGSTDTLPKQQVSIQLRDFF